MFRITQAHFLRTHCIGGILKMSNFNKERATTLTSADRIKVLIIDDSLISRDRRIVADAFFCSLR